MEEGSTDTGTSVSSVCVECGEKNDQALYKKFTGGAIQLSQCVKCKCVLDKYVEFDAVILLLDILLLKIQTYRHLIFNYGLTTSFLTKFCVLLILCQTCEHSKLRSLGLNDASTLTLQVHFHSLLLQSTAELACLLAVSFLLVRVFCPVSANNTLSGVFRAVVISSFGKLTSVAAVVWTGDYFLWLPTVLVLPAHIQAFRALLDVSLSRACAIVLLQSAFMYYADYILNQWRTHILMYLLTLP